MADAKFVRDYMDQVDRGYNQHNSYVQDVYLVKTTLSQRSYVQWKDQFIAWLEFRKDEYPYWSPFNADDELVRRTNIFEQQLSSFIQKHKDETGSAAPPYIEISQAKQPTGPPTSPPGYGGQKPAGEQMAEWGDIAVKLGIGAGLIFFASKLIK